MKKPILILTFTFLFIANYRTQNDLVSMPNNELSNLSMLNGEWTITSFYQNDEGDYEPKTIKHKLKGEFLYDNNSFMIQKYGENGNNDYSFSIIYFNQNDSCLKMDYYDIKNNNIQNFYALDEEILTFISYPKNDKTNTLTKIEFKELNDNKIQEIKYFSNDSGVNWKRKSYFNIFSK